VQASAPDASDPSPPARPGPARRDRRRARRRRGDRRHGGRPSAGAPPAHAGEIRPLHARFQSGDGVAGVAPLSFCGEPRHGGLDLACGGAARAPKRTLRLRPGSSVRIRFAEPVLEVHARFERVTASGAIQRLTHDHALRPRRGVYTATPPTPMPAGLVLAVTARYRDVVYVPGLERNVGAVDAARAEFGVRLAAAR
jgi:hypothetical protein